VPPEIIFDQGLGDLFVIRVAGNVVDDIALASIEYAAEHLHSPLLMVLVHSNCGAVQAAIEGGEAEGHLSSITRVIRKVLDEVKDKPGDLLDNAIRAHAILTSEKLKTSKPILVELVNDGKLKVVSAYYHLSSGKVEVLS
jgi:carbonic anhydrase